MTRRFASEAGTMLVEVVLSALVVGILAVGVMTGFDVSAKASGDAKQKAAAANIAEQQLEDLRSQRTSVLTALTGAAETVSKNGVSYTMRRTAAWVSQPATGSVCSSAVGPPTYLRISVSVSWPGKSSKPVTVTSLLAPGARGALTTQGALVIRIKDISDNGVAGVPVNIGGGYPQGVTDSQGCVSWSPVTAATYSMSFTKAGYVTQTGATNVTDSISVAGQQLAERTYTYSQASTVSGTFITKRNGTDMTSNLRTGWSGSGTAPKVSLANPDGVLVTANVAADGSWSATVPPSTSTYTIYGGGCTAARPPAANETTRMVGPGANVTGVQVRLPALDPITKVQGSVVNGVAQVTDVCGVEYTRATTAASGGKLADPGFPYSLSDINICGQVSYGGENFLNWAVVPGNGTYRKNDPGPNTNFTGATATTFDFGWTWFIFTVILDSGWSKTSC
ncbi:MAG: type II secretion system protein [Solirubrobacteraceae bacterium]|nr:type II secretion system protein [Solirubrobacteraceae bacterium]